MVRFTVCSTVLNSDGGDLWLHTVKRTGIALKLINGIRNLIKEQTMEQQANYNNRRDANNITLFMFDMIEKIKQNKHKEPWLNLKFSKLIVLLNHEIGELIDELRKHEIDYFAAKRECADVANFAFFLWDKLTQLEQKKAPQ